MGDVFTGIATLLVAIVAYRGLSTWKDQLREGPLITVPADALVAVHGLCDVLRELFRDPTDKDLRAVPRRENEDERSWELRASFEFARHKLESHIGVIDSVRSASFKVRAWLSDDAYEAIALVTDMARLIPEAFEHALSHQMRVAEMAAEHVRVEQSAEEQYYDQIVDEHRDQFRVATQIDTAARRQVMPFFENGVVHQPKLRTELDRRERKCADILKRLIRPTAS